jgi:Flp pilus assembly protein TadD
LQEAIRLRPVYWEARAMLGAELAEKGRLLEALAEFQEVTRLKPDYAAGHFNLGVALAKTGQLTNAANEFRETLRLDPGHKLAGSYLRNLEEAAQKQGP